MSPISKKIRACFWLWFCLAAIGLGLISQPTLLAQEYASQDNRDWQTPPTAEFTAPNYENSERWSGGPLPQFSDVRRANHELAVHGGLQSTNESGILVSLPKEEGSALPGHAARQNDDWVKHIKQKFAGADVRKMLGSLAVVLGGYLGFVWMWRRFSPHGVSGLPSEVLEIIGQTPFGPKKNLQLVRLGTKLLLLINGPEGTHPIGEVTDQTEVDHITTLCSERGYRGQSAKHTLFRKLANQLQHRVPQVQQQGHTTTTARRANSDYPPQVVATPSNYHPPATRSSSTGELEQILKTLTQAVRQTQHKNEFEA